MGSGGSVSRTYACTHSVSPITPTSVLFICQVPDRVVAMDPAVIDDDTLRRVAHVSSRLDAGLLRSKKRPAHASPGRAPGSNATFVVIEPQIAPVERGKALRAPARDPFASQWSEATAARLPPAWSGSAMWMPHSGQHGHNVIPERLLYKDVPPS
jgi:hypothetical protein